MSSTAVFDAVFALQNAVDDVLKHFDNGGLGSLSDEEFTEIALEVEATRRRLATTDYPLVAEVPARDLPAQELTRNAAGWLGKAFRLTPAQARARVREAEALGDRRALSGEVLEPVRPRIRRGPPPGDPGWRACAGHAARLPRAAAGPAGRGRGCLRAGAH